MNLSDETKSYIVYLVKKHKIENPKDIQLYCDPIFYSSKTSNESKQYKKRIEFEIFLIKKGHGYKENRYEFIYFFIIYYLKKYGRIYIRNDQKFYKEICGLMLWKTTEKNNNRRKIRKYFMVLEEKGEVEKISLDRIFYIAQSDKKGYS